MGVPRASSRQSVSGKPNGDSRYADDDSKTSVKVGTYQLPEDEDEDENHP